MFPFREKEPLHLILYINHQDPSAPFVGSTNACKIVSSFRERQTR